MSSIVEPLGPGLDRCWRLDEVLLDTNTAYQHVVIARTAQGVSLFCDDDRQSTELSQLVYHEALIVPALLLAEQIERVLIIGSSEGVASQIAVAAGATVVDHIDIDQQVVEICAEHLPYGYTVEELDRAVAHDGPIRVTYGDGIAFVVETSDEYDVIVIDLPDERADEAQHNRLYESEFLRACRQRLRPGGVVINQAGCPTLWRNETLKRSWSRFNATFDTVAYFGSLEHEWAFVAGRADRVADPLAQMLKRLTELPYRPQSIDEETLKGSHIPPYSIRHA